MKVLAHRGVVGRHPENTLGAFEEAVRAGVDGIETDVRLTADGQLVLHHDRVLPDGRALATLTMGELRRALAPAPVATVEQALHHFPGLLWNLEVKVETALPPLLGLLREHLSRRHVVLTSVDHDALLHHAKGQGLRLGALIAHRPNVRTGFVERLPVLGEPTGFDLVVWEFEHLGEIGCLEACGVASWVYGPVTPEEHASLADRGLEAVITDHPERAVGLRGAR